MSRRLVVDITSTARWNGGSVGIARVEAELARRAPVFWNGAISYTYFSANDGAFFEPDRATVEALLERSNHRPPGSAFEIMAAESMRVPATAFRHPRKSLVRRLGNMFLDRSRNQSQRQAIKMALRFLANADEYRYFEAKEQYGIIRGREFEFSGEDVLLSMGIDWLHKNPDQVFRTKNSAGAAYVGICYDIIPQLLPEYCDRAYVDIFSEYADLLVANADLIMCISQTVQSDLNSYYGRRNIPIAATDFFHLGNDLPPARDGISIPAELSGKRFVLLASTIEPRKNHRLVFEVWKHLVREGLIPDDYNLVFVGRIGGYAEALLDEIDRCRDVKGRINIFSTVDDDLLVSLYSACAFTLLPSFYEGYGLTALESLSLGKYCIASNRGSLPEVTPKFMKLLDPRDFYGWANEICTLINSPVKLNELEQMIRHEFKITTWDQAAQTFYGKIASWLENAGR
jgi:glycosyltransferase involved in cell wall biosynthesis